MRLPLLVLHIGGGIVGILAGFLAAFLRKGSRGHALAGQIFIVSMMTMASSALWLAIVKHQVTNIFAAVLTFYFVATAWFTVRRRAGETVALDWAALLFGLGVGMAEVTYGTEALLSSDGLKDGYPAPLYFIFGSVALLGVFGDIRMLVRGGIFGAQRLARHLWRMCFALFMAAASFFLGQQKVMPAFIQGSPLLFVPAFLPLLLMIFWLIRVHFCAHYKGSASDHRPSKSRGRLQESPLAG